MGRRGERGVPGSLEDGLSIQVHYIEGRTSGADGELRQRLSDLMAGLGHLPGFLAADLLSSPTQPHLCLLESRWMGAVPELEIPTGCRAWTFTVTESWTPPPQA